MITTLGELLLLLKPEGPDITSSDLAEGWEPPAIKPGAWWCSIDQERETAQNFVSTAGGWVEVNWPPKSLPAPRDRREMQDAE